MSPTLSEQHANDYDQQRMFLGPYSGRHPDIIPHLRGVMTNPNCEYRLDPISSDPVPNNIKIS